MLNALRPRQPLASDDVDVEVVDGLQALLVVVPLGLWLPISAGDEKKVPEQHLLKRSCKVITDETSNLKQSGVTCLHHL